MTITVETEGVEELQKFLDNAPFWQFRGARKALADYVLAADESIKQQVANPLSSDGLHVRTGALRRSFNQEVHGDSLSTLGASNYTLSKYAPIHQFGGTIYAKKAYMKLPGGPYLNIPLPPNRTASGVQRLSAAQVFASGGYIIPTTSSWKAKYVVRLGSENMFALVKYVDIKKRLNFIETVEKGVPTLLSNIGKSVIEQGLQE